MFCDLFNILRKNANLFLNLLSLVRRPPLDPLSPVSAAERDSVPVDGPLAVHCDALPLLAVCLPYLPPLRC